MFKTKWFVEKKWFVAMFKVVLLCEKRGKFPMIGINPLQFN